jgi:hypothetical protein
MSERPIIVFDVNETLLDLDSLNPVFARIFNDPAATPPSSPAGSPPCRPIPRSPRPCDGCAGPRGPATAAQPRLPAVHPHRQHAGNLRAAAGARRQPDYIGQDLDVIADQLIEQYTTAANAS